MRALDRAVFEWINGWPEFLSPFFVFMSEATKIPAGRIALIAIALGLLAYPKTRKTTVLALIAWPLANGFTEAFKTAIPMLRPCVELADVHLRVGRLDSFGTASSHSANTAAVAVVFWRLHGKWGLIAVALAFFTGLSRIFVGVHYPSQVLLGWLCGALCALIVMESWAAYRRLSPRKNASSSD